MGGRGKGGGGGRPSGAGSGAGGAALWTDEPGDRGSRDRVRAPLVIGGIAFGASLFDAPAGGGGGGSDDSGRRRRRDDEGDGAPDGREDG